MLEALRVSFPSARLNFVRELNCLGGESLNLRS
jgi:hypothetical protein